MRARYPTWAVCCTAVLFYVYQSMMTRGYKYMLVIVGIIFEQFHETVICAKLFRRKITFIPITTSQYDYLFFYLKSIGFQFAHHVPTVQRSF